jgi:predicted secreted hydrolase
MKPYAKGRIVFPADEGDKDTPFDWWYMTAHFTSDTGRKFGYTVVYISNGPNCCIRQTSIIDNVNHTYFWELMEGALFSKKGSLNLAYSNSHGDTDFWRQKGDCLFDYSLSTEIRNHSKLYISLVSNKPPMVHNDGLILMGHGGVSFYYSLTNLALDGTFVHNGVAENIHGVAWIDRQWGSWDTNGYDGWEWFALQLNDNTEIMLYAFYDFLSGKRISHVLTLMLKDGTSINLADPKMFSLTNLDYWKVNQKSKGPLQNIPRSYFSNGWRLSIPAYKIDLTIKPIMKDQRIDNGSWEGSCRVIGKHEGLPIDSLSTVELTHLYVYPRQIRLIKNLLRKILLKPLFRN